MTAWAQLARRIRVPLGFALAVFYFFLARPSWTSLLAGTALAMPGLLLRAVASGYVAKNRSLTTGGPYAYTRNPLYLGSIIIALGFAVAARSWWIVLALLLIFLLVYLPVIRAEEQYLRAQFPQYADYARRVPRLIPLFRKQPESRGSFSRGLYLQHREYNSLLGAAAMIAALIAKILWWHPH